MNRATLFLSAAAFSLAGAFSPVLAQDSVMVGGAEMFASKTIAENAPNAENLTTLVAAAKAAGLVETLAGPGPLCLAAKRTQNAFNFTPKPACR